MSNVVITNSSEFEQIINNLERSFIKINDIYADEEKRIEIINKTNVWTSKTQETLYDKLQLLSKNYAPIEEATRIYIKFLRETLADYKRFERTTDQNILQNTDNLDVNS